MDAGVHPSLHSKYHHQRTYTKLDLQIGYPSPYTRELWDYCQAHFDLINKTIEHLDWNKLFLVKILIINLTVLIQQF